MHVLSKNPLWESFGLRALSYTNYGGADLGECYLTVERVGEGTAEDWYREWNKTAERIETDARESQEKGHGVSAREAFFRASTYYRVSYLPLFGDPVDDRLTDAFERETKAFHRAAELSEHPIELVEIPFERSSMPAYFVRPSQRSEALPTLLQVNGYDSNIQEMYFAHALAAIRRGYNVLLLDGPGQGRNLIRDRLPIRPDWENVVRPILDYLLSRPEVDSQRVVLAGWSFGGFLAPRAAAFEKRIAALIADPGQWDQRLDLTRFGLPVEVAHEFPNIDAKLLAPFEEQLRSDAMMWWKIVQRGFWVHGANSVYDLLREMARFELSSVAGEISCPTLLTTVEGDPVAANAEILYGALRCPKRLVRFTEQEGAGGHCEGLARSLYHQRVFDWLDETLGASQSQAAIG